VVGKSEVDVIVTEDFVIGMPQLALGGLSENWLLKECGNQHWIALAKCLGLPTPDFINQQGQKMYAAFLVVKITKAAFGQVYENNLLTIKTGLQRVTSSRSYSHHEIHVKGQCIAHVELLSSFVNRTEEGNNQSVARGEVFKGEWFACEAATLMMKEHKAGRAVTDNVSDEPSTYKYQPCPYSDFNGADFLYFAQFQAVMDRAERHIQMTSNNTQMNRRLWQTFERTICYYGNINLDDSLTVSLQDLRFTSASNMKTEVNKELNDEIAHIGRLHRRSDNSLIANIHTRKVHMEHPLSLFQVSLISNDGHEKKEEIK